MDKRDGLLGLAIDCVNNYNLDLLSWAKEMQREINGERDSHSFQGDFAPTVSCAQPKEFLARAKNPAELLKKEPNK